MKRPINKKITLSIGEAARIEVVVKTEGTLFTRWARSILMKEVEKWEIESKQDTSCVIS